MKSGLTADDRAWLESFRSRINAEFGHLVASVTVFGSKARGDATEESDLDLLVVVEGGDWRLKWDVADVAYDLAIGTDVVPSVKVYTRPEWDRLRELESAFHEAVVRDGVAVA